MKVLEVGAELVRADRQTVGYDEFNSKVLPTTL